jgi:DegV family protein with EDD domain
VRFGDKSYREGLEISRDEFYRRLEEGNERPSTSQPAPGDFMKVFEEFAAAGDQILSLHISGKLSGTVNSALSAKNSILDDYQDAEITILDSQSASLGLGLMVKEAALMAQEGKAMGEIIGALESMIRPNYAILVVGDLDYLSSGGRLTKTQAFFGNLLNVMPIIALENGSLKPVDRAFGVQAAIRKMIAFIGEKSSQKPPRRIAFVYGSMKDEMETLRALCKEAYPHAQTISGRAGAVIASHVGPKVMAALWH